MVFVYRKTAKGQTEIETRANRLTPRMRASLILVDGKRSDDELRALIAAGADEALATLLELEYIEVVATTSPPPSPSRSTASAPPAATATPRKLDDARRMAVRFLNEHMGPSAESLAMKIEKAQNWDELRPHLEMAEHFLRAARGASTANDFAAKFIDRANPSPT